MPLFQEAHNFVVNGGYFTEITHGSSPLVQLQQHTASGAAHDSQERFPPPKCHPRTRERALRIIIAWIKTLRKERTKSVQWLHAPAGMGKSAIAQTIAEECEELDILAATFFFSRGDPKRNRAEKLVASIALQLCESIPELVPHVEAIIRSTPTILTKSLPIQLNKLVIGPFRKIPPIEEDRVVIIDGLDECIGAEPQKVDPAHEQLLVLKLVDTMLSAGLPLSFLICSRPESWIKDGFQTLPSLWACTEVLDLYHNSDMDQDVETYLRPEFARIREASNLPESWPSEGDLKKIVRNASGQFIYAATVIRYVDDPWNPPQDRLNAILAPKIPMDHNPLEALDNLYLTILEMSTNRTLVLETLGCLEACQPSVFGYSTTSVGPSIAHLCETICHWPRQALRALHSLVRTDGTARQASFFHATFLEFLHSPFRSKGFYITKTQYVPYFVGCCLRYLASASNLPFDRDTPFDVIKFAADFWQRSWGIRRFKLSTDSVSLEILNALLAYDLSFNDTHIFRGYTLESALFKPIGSSLSDATLTKLGQCLSHLQNINDTRIIDCLNNLDGTRQTSIMQAISAILEYASRAPLPALGTAGSPLYLEGLDMCNVLAGGGILLADSSRSRGDERRYRLKNVILRALDVIHVDFIAFLATVSRSRVYGWHIAHEAQLITLVNLCFSSLFTNERDAYDRPINNPTDGDLGLTIQTMFGSALRTVITMLSFITCPEAVLPSVKIFLGEYQQATLSVDGRKVMLPVFLCMDSWENAVLQSILNGNVSMASALLDVVLPICYEAAEDAERLRNIEIEAHGLADLVTLRFPLLPFFVRAEQNIRLGGLFSHFKKDPSAFLSNMEIPCYVSCTEQGCYSHI